MCTQYGLLKFHDVIITSLLTSEVWFIGGGHPQHVVVFQEMSRIEDIGDEQSWVFGKVAERDMGVASLLQLVL